MLIILGEVFYKFCTVQSCFEMRSMFYKIHLRTNAISRVLIHFQPTFPKLLRIFSSRVFGV